MVSANKYFFTSYKPQTYRYTPALGILNFTQEIHNELNREKSVRWDAASVAPPAAAIGAFRCLPLHRLERGAKRVRVMIISLLVLPKRQLRDGGNKEAEKRIP